MNPHRPLTNIRHSLLLSVVLITLLWLCVLILCSLGDHDQHLQLVTSNSDLFGRSNISQLVPSFYSFNLREAQDRHEELGVRDTLQHLLHALTSVAAVSELKAVLAGASGASASQLCHWLKNDVTKPKGQQKVLVAGLLTNTEALMPHYILQLLEFAASMPAGFVFVSIYESGSSDNTGVWLSVLAELLIALDVPHQIQTGGVTRQDNEGRIQFLAKVRNKVLEPLLWQSNHTVNSSSTHGGHSGSSSNSRTDRHRATQASSKTFLNQDSKCNSKSSSISSCDSKSSFAFKADKVVFLNDVYFCAQHIHRLLAHEGVNLACGLDYYQVSTAKVLKYIPKAWRQGPWGLQPLFLRFYDNWVARDAEGTIFSRAFDNVARDAYGTHRMQQGLPFPVTCCWNGLAVFDAAPLQQSGLKFRDAMQHDCPASECSHFCEDLRRFGYDRMVVDPAVRVGYDYDVATALDKGKWQTFVPWAEAKQHKIDWGAVPHRPDMMCCPAPHIDSCYKRSIYGSNNTASSFQMASAASQAL